MRLLQTFKELLNYCQVEVLGVEVIRAKHTVGVHMQVKYPITSAISGCVAKAMGQTSSAADSNTPQKPALSLSLPFVVENSDRARGPRGFFSIITT